MPELREELCECAIGDIAFESVACVPEVPNYACTRLIVPGPFERIPHWDDKTDAANFAIWSLNRPRFEFERALATLPGSTAKVRVWKRVS